MLEAGGNLHVAAQHYGAPPGDWLDLSTTINPAPYPIPPISPACWHRLPEENDGLEAAAADYYGNDKLVVLPGAQAAARALPVLFRPAVVAGLAPIFEEYPQTWERAGHKLRRLPTLERVLAAATPIALLCNPNNLTAAFLTRRAVLDAASQLQRRGGWLIVDETHGDSVPEDCCAALAGSADAPNLIVLREPGCFFGLAGARVGFVFGAAEKLDRLREMIGPWPVANPSRAVVRQALQDSAWQAGMRHRLASSSQRLAGLLAPLGEARCAALFCTITTPHVAPLFEHFALRAILARRFDQYGLLRFGLPGREEEWQRLSEATAEWKLPC